MAADYEINEFKNALRQELKNELDYYGFTITGACNEWINSVIDYFMSLADWESQPIDMAIEELMSSADEMEEEYEFAWPDETEAVAIVGKALRNDSSHFEYITEMLNYSMCPDDCFKAEWFWQGSIRPSIMRWLERYNTHKA